MQARRSRATVAPKRARARAAVLQAPRRCEAEALIHATMQSRVARRCHGEARVSLVELMTAMTLSACLGVPLGAGFYFGLRSSADTRSRLARSNRRRYCRRTSTADVQGHKHHHDRNHGIDIGVQRDGRNSCRPAAQPTGRLLGLLYTRSGHGDRLDAAEEDLSQSHHHPAGSGPCRPRQHPDDHVPADARAVPVTLTQPDPTGHGSSPRRTASLEERSLMLIKRQFADAAADGRAGYSACPHPLTFLVLVAVIMGLVVSYSSRRASRPPRPSARSGQARVHGQCGDRQTPIHSGAGGLDDRVPPFAERLHSAHRPGTGDFLASNQVTGPQ